MLETITVLPERAVLPEREVEMKQQLTWKIAILPHNEVAMRRVIRCSECYSEGANVISLINPAHEHYCGAVCLYKGQENFIHWILRANAEAAF
jgi:hypothetical protein